MNIRGTNKHNSLEHLEQAKRLRDFQAIEIKIYCFTKLRYIE